MNLEQDLSLEAQTISITVGGKEITFETGKVGRQAGGAVIVRLGETTVFATACSNPKLDPQASFFPLRVDYQEKFSSAGKTLGGFIKREGRPTEREILVCRLIDRPIRPMFPDGYYNEVQLLAFVWSYDGVHYPDTLAICAASAALCLSDIPFIKPVGAVRVGLVGENIVINPTVEEMKTSRLDLMLAGTEDAILMVEGHCDFLSEEIVLQAIEEGQKSITTICHALKEWQQRIGKPKAQPHLKVPTEAANDAVQKLCAHDLGPSLRILQKKEREHALERIKEEIHSKLVEPNGPFPAWEVEESFKKLSSHLLRRMVIEENLRCDGRTKTNIRPIHIEQTFLPRTHGSSLFTRGETQAVAVCTLGGATMGQRYEDLNGEGTSRFYMQYSFPPFSVGEVSRVGPPGRREVGHGKLAERALLHVLPDEAEFPYTIRLESNITESNGSSSMASVCGGCLAMMDAGVPIKRPVSGIAMGLILEEDSYSILSDILGIEDALGDMDFKVTGDEHGITAFQMDIKVEGITHAIMQAALEQAKAGRLHILKKMLQACPSSKKEMSIYAPRIETIQIKPSKIGIVIGPGGKQIRAIIEETGVDIDINDAGIVSISSNNGEAMARAKAIINGLVAEIEVGKVYTGCKVTSVVAFGAFVELLPGKEGLCHISELDKTRVVDIFAHVKVGDIMDVKVLEMNDKGQYRLSRKVLL